MNSKKKNIVIVILIIFVILIGGYFILTSPKKYEVRKLNFKLPSGFVKKGQNNYTKEIYSSKSNGVFCSVNVEVSQKDQEQYDISMDTYKRMYKGNQENKTINGTTWFHISSDYDPFKADIFLNLINSDYYEVIIRNSQDNPCSDKDINTIINSLKINK